MTQQIIGREREREILDQAFKSHRSEFLAVYGRRRVGKTYLIRNFFSNQDCVFLYCSGLQKGKRRQQLEEFYKQIGLTFYNGASLTKRTRWMDALEDLTKACAQVPQDRKIVLFFDELPWMATPRSGLLEALDYYWNRYWSHSNNIKLIVCGSSSSWIIEKIINNKGGLYNRVTRTMRLAPFTLAETYDFLHANGIKLNHKQVLELYMVCGGIPHYLALIRKGISAQQAIDELFFQSNGALVQEFERLFSALFKRASVYMNLIRIISEHHYGIGQAKLLSDIRISDGGRTKSRLTELEQAGFIISFVPHGHKDKGIYYKVIDEFCLFYLRWVEPNQKNIAKQEHADGYWLAKSQTPSWKIWAGYAFECICYKHIAQIRRALHISSGAEVGTWRYSPHKSEGQGAQIDLLFDRDDGVITICEIKHNAEPFVLDKEYAKTLLAKLQIYTQVTKTTKQLFLAMITVNGVKQNMYAEEIVHGVVTIEHLFARLTNAVPVVAMDEVISGG